MKHFFMLKHLLASAIVCLLSLPNVVAQSFQFKYHGEPVPNGSTVTIHSEPDPYGFEEMWCETNPSDNPTNGLMLELLSGTTANGNATLTIDENTLNAGLMTWCMGGACVPFGNKTFLEKSFTVQNGSMQVQFDAQNIQADNSYLIATLVATIGTETQSIKIKFVNGEIGGDVVPGDVNGDGKVTSVDITALYNWLLNNDDSAIVNGDQDGDSKITSVDITVIYNILLGSN